MMVLGVTGGIGSGKTTVCKAFFTLGIPVFYSDIRAREIMNNDVNLKNELNKTTGVDLFSGGELNRPLLAQIIFNDSKMLEKINRLVHPLVFSAFKKWSEQQASSYVILEAAILFESKADILTDRILGVTAPFEERIMRVMTRNNLTREQVFERIKSQIPENELISRSDFILDNGENRMILPKILEIHNEMLNLVNRNN